MTTASQLRTLLSGPPFIAADCYSALTARIVEEVGFQAAYMGGHATGMMHYAIPDNGVLTPTEMIDQAARVAEVISIPLIVDADQAGETVADVYRSIRRYENVGVAGVHIEDEIPPKHSAWDGPLVPMADMQARIRAAVDARRSDDFVVIARSDEIYDVGGGGTGSLDEAIRRGVAYAEAGADAYLPTFATEEQLAAIAEEVSIPLACYGTPIGVAAFSLSTGWGTSTAARFHRQWATQLLQSGELPPEAFGFPDRAGVIQQQVYDEVIGRWVDATGRSRRPPAP